MDNKILTSIRYKNELRNSDIINQFFKVHPDRNYCIFNIFQTNGATFSAYVIREEYRQNNINFNVYSTLTNTVIPDEFYTKFSFGLKSIKPIEIPLVEAPKTLKYSKQMLYVLSEFLTPVELFNKEYFDLFLYDNKPHNLVSFIYNPKNGVYDITLKNVSNGAMVYTNTNNPKLPLIAGIIASLNNKKHKNKQQYVMLLCNVLYNEYIKDSGYYNSYYGFSKFETYYNKYRDILYRTKTFSNENSEMFYTLFSVIFESENN